MNGFAFQVQAVEADVDDKTDHREQCSQRIGLGIQQAYACNTEYGRVEQGQLQRNQTLHQDPVTGPFHALIDVTINAVVEHATGRNDQGSTDDCSQKHAEVDIPLGSQKKATCHRKHVTENDPRLGDLDKVLQ